MLYIKFTILELLDISKINHKFDTCFNHLDIEFNHIVNITNFTTKSQPTIFNNKGYFNRYIFIFNMPIPAIYM